MRTCSRCGIEKEDFLFNRSKHSNGGFRPECKECHKTWYEAYKSGCRVKSESRGGITEKTCGDCGETKPLDSFHRRQRHSILRVSVCKLCMNRRSAEYCKRKNEEDPGWSRRRGRKRNLKSNYGMTRLQYEEMLRNQSGVCAICGGNGGEREMAVDHSHDTGKIRGLLCSKCNVMLGMARDDINTLECAIRYLKERN